MQEIHTNDHIQKRACQSLYILVPIQNIPNISSVNFQKLMLLGYFKSGLVSSLEDKFVPLVQ